MPLLNVSKIPFGAFRHIFAVCCAHNSHTCNLRCIFVHVHAAAKNDFNRFAAFAANSAKPFSTV